MTILNSYRLQIFALSILLGLGACGGGSTPQDPRVTGFAIAYVKRPFPLRDPEQDDQVIQPDLRDPLQFNPGSDLYIRDHASAQAQERNISSGITLGAGDVKDVEVSYDGKKLLFALKEPDIEGRQPEEQPTWNIWEYNIETGRLRKVISQDIFSEEGHDVAPHYLPDGRIVFSSSRQYGSKETLTNEAKPRYTSLVDQEQGQQRHAMMLHVMNKDGTDIRQITFAPVIDMDPYVRRDGKVIFTRWDRFFGSDSINIYSINPDGTDLQLLYGAHSHAVIDATANMQFSQIREFPDGRALSIMRTYTDTFGGGDIALIDTDSFADYGKPVSDYAGISGTGLSSLTGGTASATITPSMGGRFISVFPLWDGSDRSLVSWTPCLLMQGTQSVPCSEAGLADPDVVEAEPLYNLYIFDHAQQTKVSIFLPSADEAITDVVAAQPRAYPHLIEDSVEGSTKKSGILHIRSVYDYDGNFDDRGAGVTITDASNPIPEFVQNTQPDDRQARFLRLIKPFVRSDRDDFDIPNLAFGRSGGRDGLMEIIGYAPIEPDGSVKVRVPADVPFGFQIVDKNGRRINEQRHMSWLQIRKGETLECNGCHDHNSEIPHGRRDAINPVNKGAETSGPFPGQDSAMLAVAGETMAETRIRYSCDTDNCNGLNPSVDIKYVDVWSISAAASFKYEYNFTDTTPDPVSVGCATAWTERCRTIINYVTHIDPLWSKPRTHSTQGPVTCSQAECHSPVDSGGMPMVPKPSIPIPVADPPPRLPPTPKRLPPAQTGSQLNLDNVSTFDEDDDPDRLEAYRELLFNDIAQEIVDGVLVNAEFDGDPIFEEPLDPLDPPVLIGYVPITINTTPGRTMVQGSANGSRFFDIFSETTADPIHWDGVLGQAILTPGELKLISEWLDIGAQYYNDPFAVPD